MITSLQPRRIKEGRIFRNMTQVDLAEALGISKQAISQYETGVITPTPEILSSIASLLDFPLAYFSKPYTQDILTPVFFRKRKTTPKKLTERYKTYIGWMTEIYSYIEEYIHVPELRLLTAEKVGYLPSEIAEIATKLRRHWGLGDGPISNLTLLLENNGILISKVDLDPSKADACSVFFTSPTTEKRPIIFLTSGTTAVRSRRDLAHELGHQVLHSWMDKEEFNKNEEIVEREAETFASYFLMPEAAMRRECYTVSNINSLFLLKSRWGASAQSILYHLSETGCLSESMVERLKNQFYRKGWRKHEPGDDDLPQEKPELIKDAITMLVDHHVKTPEEILDDLSMPADDVAALCGTAPNFFVRSKIINKPKLCLIK